MQAKRIAPEPTKRVTIALGSGCLNYWYFEGVSAERAVELAEWYVAARCMFAAEVLAVQDA